MIWPPQNVPLFRYKTPCCECPEEECFLELPGDITLGETLAYSQIGAPYDNNFSAIRALADVVDCLVLFENLNAGFTTYDSYSVSAGSSTFDIDYVIQAPCGPSPPPSFGFLCLTTSIQWFAIDHIGGDIPVDYSVIISGTTTGGNDYVRITIYDADYNEVDMQEDLTQGDASGTWTLSGLSAGKYIVNLEMHREIESVFNPYETVTTHFGFAFPEGTTVCPPRSTYLGTGGTTPFQLPCCSSFETRYRGDFAACCGFTYQDSAIQLSGCWKSVAFSGSVTTDTYDGADCSGTITHSSTFFPGDPCSMDDECVVTGPCYNGYTDWPSSPNTVIPGNPVELQWDNCVPFAPSQHQHGSIFITFSDPTTFAEALARLLAGGGPAWSDWIATPVIAMYPTGMQEGYYFEAEWRINQGGLLPSTDYEVVVEYWRRAYDEYAPTLTADFELYQTVVVTATTDGSGVFTASDTVPNDEGFQTVAICRCVFTEVIPPP